MSTDGNKYDHEASSVNWYMTKESQRGGDFAARARVYRQQLKGPHARQELETRALACEALAAGKKPQEQGTV